MSGLRYTQDGSVYLVPSVDVTSVYNEGFDAGKKEGYKEGKEECDAKHWIVDIEGDDTGAITFPCPFTPDTITIFGYDGVYYSLEPVYNSVVKGDAYPGGVANYVYSRTYSDIYGGSVGIYGMPDGGSRCEVISSGSAGSGHSTRYSRSETDKTITISNIVVARREGTEVEDTGTFTLYTKYYSGVFVKGCIYHIVCEKHTE